LLYAFQHAGQNGNTNQDDTDEQKNEETRQIDEKEPESPFKVVKRRDSNLEPVTALASDDLDKHAYPETPPPGEEKSNADDNAVKQEDSPNIERIGSGIVSAQPRPISTTSIVTRNESPEPKEEPSNEPFDTSLNDDDVVIRLLTHEVLLPRISLSLLSVHPISWPSL
jgi:hypothetical protein